MGEKRGWLEDHMFWKIIYHRVDMQVSEESSWVPQASKQAVYSSVGLRGQKSRVYLNVVKDLMRQLFQRTPFWTSFD